MMSVFVEFRPKLFPHKPSRIFAAICRDSRKIFWFPQYTTARFATASSWTIHTHPNHGRENKRAFFDNFDVSVRICFSVTCASESFQVFYAAASIGRTRLDKYSFRFLIYLTSQLNLFGALRQIVLVDAYSNNLQAGLVILPNSVTQQDSSSKLTSIEY